MRTITLSLPENIDLENKEIMMILAASLYEKSKLSLGQAADLAGISKRNFIENLGDYGVSIFNFPASELSDDVKNIQL